MKIEDVTKEQVEKAISESVSIAEVGRRLGATTNSVAHKTAKKLAAKFNLPLPKNGGSAANLGLRNPNYVSDEVYFTKGTSKGGPELKARMLKKGVIDECSIEECFVTNVWEGKPLELEVDHINGDSLDNTFDNLRLLCPNCHLQTATHSRKAR